jgi:hypothetical protein
MEEHVDVDRERRLTSVETTMRPPTTVSTATTNPGIKHCN